MCLSYFITTVHPWEDFFCSPSSLSIGRDINRIQLCEDPNIKFYKWFPPRKGNYKFTFLEPPNSGPSQGLKIQGGGACSTVVGIICPLVDIGLTVWPLQPLQPPCLQQPCHLPGASRAVRGDYPIVPFKDLVPMDSYCVCNNVIY